MLNSIQMTLVKKDIRSVTVNRSLFIALLIVPFVMAVVLPVIFLSIILFMPADSLDFQQFLVLLPEGTPEGEMRPMLIELILNSIVPIFFLIIPVMISSIMAASSFVGEKEKRTLETLLYCPLSLRQIFTAKITASFALSQFISLMSFAAMILVVQVLLWVAGKMLIPLGMSWLVLMLIVSPALSLVAITLIVRGSAKAKSIEEAQQRSVFLILPIVALAAGQFSGLTASVWLMLGFGLLCAIIGLVLLRRASASFNYERLLL